MYRCTHALVLGHSADHFWRAKFVSTRTENELSCDWNQCRTHTHTHTHTHGKVFGAKVGKVSSTCEFYHLLIVHRREFDLGSLLVFWLMLLCGAIQGDAEPLCCGAADSCWERSGAFFWTVLFDPVGQHGAATKILETTGPAPQQWVVTSQWTGLLTSKDRD